jgi:molybdate transport system substrate-binding protein
MPYIGIVTTRVRLVRCFPIRWFSALAVLVLFTGSFVLRAQTLRVAAAADLQPVLPSILEEFEQRSSVHVEASYQSSAVLATQIVNGGPFDLFLAADFSFPQRVIDAGLADSDKPVPYARGTLVLFARKDSRFGDLTMDSLRDTSLRRLAIANPEHAPYGRAAKAAIASLGLTDQLSGKLVVAENIAQAAQFVDSGNAELGLISLTSALSDRLQMTGNYVEVPRNAYPPILQGAVVIKKSENREAAHRLLDYLLSAGVQRGLAEHGLQPAGRASRPAGNVSRPAKTHPN